MEFSESRRPVLTPDARREEILAAPGFGKHFTDHMVTATWTAGQGWHDAGLVPYGPIQMDPASAVLHYAQEIFEGLKAYRHADGSVWTFRPEANGARLARSAQRLALPELPVADFVATVDALVLVSEHYTRAAVGGTGAAKTGGNYASSLAPQQEAIARGFDQVVFLDAIERRYVEELGGMNLYFVQDDGSIITPELTGT